MRAAVVALRSRLLVSLVGGGAMVSVGAGVARVEQWLVGGGIGWVLLRSMVLGRWWFRVRSLLSRS